MSLKIDLTRNQGSVNPGFDETKPCFINNLPEELLREIFSFLNLASLGSSCRVCKGWKEFVSYISDRDSDPHSINLFWKKALYREAFSNQNWVECFEENILEGEVERDDFSSLPEDIIEIFKGPCPAFPGSRMLDTHMMVRIPRTINGELLTLKSLEDLAKKDFPEICYRRILTPIIDELGDKPIEKSSWILMTKDILPGSRSKSYIVQQKIVSDLAERSSNAYEIPHTLEAVVCILTKYFRSKDRLYNDNPWTYTRCQEVIEDYQLVVGAFDRTGLSLDYSCNYGPSIIGVGAVRKF